MSKKTDQTLKKCEDLIERLQELKKALGVVTQKQSNRRPVNALGAGWSQDPGTGAFHHSTHGVISTMKNPEGGFNIVHGGKMVGQVGDVSQAGAHIKSYVGNLGAMDTGMHNRPSPMNPDTPKLGTGNSFEKSGYGPKGAGLYNPADNARRKMNNTGDVAGAGPNVNAKAYSTKPGQLSAKAQASAEAAKTKKLSGPVKQYTPAQIAAINEARKLKKNAEESRWDQHAQIPNADEEVNNLQKTNPPVVAEDLMANQLANLMQGKAMLNQPPKQPSSEEMLMAGQAMGLGVTEEMQKAEEVQWGGAINNWLLEAQKPISSRFNSPEEEDAYWASIKVADRGGNDGY